MKNKLFLPIVTTATLVVTSSSNLADPPKGGIYEYQKGIPLSVVPYFSDTMHSLSVTIEQPDGNILLAQYKRQFASNEDSNIKDSHGLELAGLAALIQSEINDGDSEFMWLHGHFPPNSRGIFELRDASVNGYEFVKVGWRQDQGLKKQGSEQQ